MIPGIGHKALEMHYYNSTTSHYFILLYIMHPYHLQHKLFSFAQAVLHFKFINLEKNQFQSIRSSQIVPAWQRTTARCRPVRKYTSHRRRTRREQEWRLCSRARPKWPRAEQSRLPSPGSPWPNCPHLFGRLRLNLTFPFSFLPVMTPLSAALDQQLYISVVYVRWRF